MSKVLTEVSTFTASVTVPEDGDDVTGSSIEVQAQALANRTKYLNAANVSTQADLDTLEATVANGQWTSMSAAQMAAAAKECLSAGELPSGWSMVLAAPYSGVALNGSGSNDLLVPLKFPNSADHKMLQLTFNQAGSTGTLTKISGNWYDSSNSISVALASYSVTAGTTFKTIDLSLDPAMSGNDGGTLMLRITPPTGGNVFITGVSVGYALGGINP
jgi:hypothetical protein